jgi:D-alanine-D-alanine ligase
VSAPPAVLPPVPVAVLLGGPSAEHDVSLVSGRAVAAALAGAGHPVEGWLIGLDGRWWRLPAAALDGRMPLTAYDDPGGLGAEGPLPAGHALDRLAARDPAPVVFIALHGPYGEDGTVQALCEAAGLVYTGSGIAASALGMDKSLFKRLVAALGMPVVPWRDVSVAAIEADRAAVFAGLAAFAAALPDPRLMIKPARLGSSVGMRIVHHPADADELGAALAEAFRFDDRALAEAYLDHPRELEMAVLGNGPEDLESHGPGEVFPGREFYDYAAKYAAGVSRTAARAAVSHALRKQLHTLARAAFLAIGGEGFARVDFLLARGMLYLSEINTIPGFTPISLFPAVCAADGRTFADLCRAILALALERDRRRPRRALTRADLP